MHKTSAAAPAELPLSSYTLLSQTRLVGDGGTLRLLGATLQVGTGYVKEWNSVRAKCWVAHHSRALFWKVKARVLHKLRILQIAIWPVLN